MSFHSEKNWKFIFFKRKYDIYLRNGDLFKPKQVFLSNKTDSSLGEKKNASFNLMKYSKR